jgi:hypothetical protein
MSDINAVKPKLCEVEVYSIREQDSKLGTLL